MFDVPTQIVAEVSRSVESSVVSGVGVFESRGRRPSQEDTHLIDLNFALQLNDGVERSLFAVFDGHLGAEAPTIARDTFGDTLTANLQAGADSVSATIQTYYSIDELVVSTGTFSGCTAVTALLEGRDLTVANAGDSRALLINMENGSVSRLSHDHNLSDKSELHRAVNAGAEVIGDKIQVESGGYICDINVLRSLGDGLCGDIISPEPHYSKITLQPGNYKLVLECDGIWNFIDDQEIPALIGGLDPQSGSETLVEQSLQRGSRDNLTALIVDLVVK
jgi:serine/threonine protein phosphatase PrpC